MKQFSFILLIGCLVSCKSDRTSTKDADIRGVWYRVVNDSIYQEVIVTDSEWYSYDHEGMGDSFVRYRIDDDSLRLYRGAMNSITYKFERLDRDRFHITHPQFKIAWYRLDAQLDTAKILSTKRSLGRPFDEEYFSQYVQAMLIRRAEWDKRGR